ncbi:hypothetical protein WJX79_008029 [Trebouxia sp. C0005]
MQFISAGFASADFAAAARARTKVKAKGQGKDNEVLKPAAIRSTVGNSLYHLIQLNEDDPALKALVEEFLRGEGTDTQSDVAWRLEVTNSLKQQQQHQGASEKFATDRTAQKVAAFQQSSSKLPPALNELERFIFTRLSAKLPVTDSYYNGLVAQNDALKEMIEPVSYSGADILAALIVAALHPEFEGNDEIVIAGQVDTLLYQIWQCMCKFDMDQADLQKAIEQLGTKMSNWGANFHGKVEYLLCYACAGPILQFCVLPRESKIPRMLGSEMSMGTQAGRLRIIAVAIQAYQVIKAQRAHLPDHYFPLSWTDHTSLSSIEFFDGYVQKRVEYSQAWPKKRRLFMTQRPKNQAELKTLTKCVLSGVQDLHNAGYGHTDIRWQNIIQCSSSYRLIDLEFVCKLKQRPFTPTGYVRKARPDLYSHKWVAEYDLILHCLSIVGSRLKFLFNGEKAIRGVLAYAS